MPKKNPKKSRDTLPLRPAKQFLDPWQPTWVFMILLLCLLKHDMSPFLLIFSYILSFCLRWDFTLNYRENEMKYKIVKTVYIFSAVQLEKSDVMWITGICSSGEWRNFRSSQPCVFYYVSMYCTVEVCANPNSFFFTRNKCRKLQYNSGAKWGVKVFLVKNGFYWWLTVNQPVVKSEMKEKKTVRE